MSKTPVFDTLTAKQKAFVNEYLVDLNATQAAIRAKYSVKTACKIGSENLQKPDIQTAIAEIRAQLTESTAITPEKVLREMGRLAFSDLRNVLDEDGNLKNPKNWDDDAAAAISSLELTGQGAEKVSKIKAWDKNSALEKIAKHLGMFQPEKHVPEIHIHLPEITSKF
jgi:phage terminase small subunit